MGSRISYRTSQERFSGHNPPSRPGTQAGYPTATSPRCSQPGRPMVVLGFLEEEARWVLWVLIMGHTGPPVMGSEEREGGCLSVQSPVLGEPSKEGTAVVRCEHILSPLGLPADQVRSE